MIVISQIVLRKLPFEKLDLSRRDDSSLALNILCLIVEESNKM